MLLKIWFVVGVFTLGIFVAPVLADDIDCRKSTDQCPPSADCRCDLAMPVQLTGSATASEGTSFTASGGRPSYRYEIGAGEINPETGVITDVPLCGQSTKVTATDACNQQAQVGVNVSAAADLLITGSNEPDVNDVYSVNGGLEPYSWSFSGGSINNVGKILSVTSCGGPSNNGAVATVSVTDSCGETASIEVRLPGGYWGAPENTCDVSVYDNGFHCYSPNTCQWEKVEGGTKSLYVTFRTDQNYQCTDNDGYDCCACGGVTHISSLGTVVRNYGCGGSEWQMIQKSSTSQWTCE